MYTFHLWVSVYFLRDRQLNLQLIESQKLNNIGASLYSASNNRNQLKRYRSTRNYFFKAIVYLLFSKLLFSDLIAYFHVMYFRKC